MKPVSSKTAVIEEKQIPTNILSLRQIMSGSWGPESLFCPADKKHRPVADWAAIEANGVSYEFVGTGQDSDKPYIKCRAHGFIMCKSGKITTPDGTRVGYLRDSDDWVELKEAANKVQLIRLKSGKWADVKSVFPDKRSESEKAQARTASARTQINSLSTKINIFQIDTGVYPKNGLIDLIQKPQNTPNWVGPYFMGDSIPKDPWGHDYIYVCPGQHNPSSYDLSSMGPDGRAAGGDDITNWQ